MMTNKLLPLLFFPILLLSGCSRDPVAVGSINPNPAYTHEEIYFENLSVNAADVEWNFGDGTVSSFSDEIHSYSEPGTYNVTLKVYGEKKGVDQASFEVRVDEGPDATANIYPNPAYLDELVHFRSYSTSYSSLEWDTGDGYVTDSVEFSHKYQEPGYYTVILKAYGLQDRGLDTVKKQLYINGEPFADGTISAITAYPGEELIFQDYSHNAESIKWDFGDGSNSKLKVVTHTYSQAGIYHITLTAYGISGKSVQNFQIEVIGTQLKIIVKEYFDEYLVPNASVILYPTLQDWENETNPVGEKITNTLGECIFTKLNCQRYYVDVWEQNHDNYTLASEDVGFIETQVLEPGFDHVFIAYVDYYPPEKKSIKSTRGSASRTVGYNSNGRLLKPDRISSKISYTKSSGRN